MNLEIRSFADAGDISKERLVLKAVADVDVGEFAVFKSGISTKGNPTSGRKIAYWFPDEKIKANDLVVLYTKKGSRRTKQMDAGRTAYFFYWGRDEPLWGDSDYGAVLIEVYDWEFKVSG